MTLNLKNSSAPKHNQNDKKSIKINLSHIIKKKKQTIKYEKSKIERSRVVTWPK